jgi:rhodanese-related sulfurtransferase
MSGVPELTPTEFANRWPAPSAGAGVVLLDVREPVELKIAALPAALHIPMREVPGRLTELDRDTPLVVMCHTGRRSGRYRRVVNGDRSPGASLLSQLNSTQTK